ncbi:trypsin-like peptidase domain-containing protein [Streptomyces filamentosus]|uniref:Trypsin-like peptidase domain-containing protein n=2 Tax=Streptomyces filamentosus TaxID=67294 RepID=A0ABY4UX54_STRFL|nr:MULTISPECIES: trypsin-like peptidase domain-containing protein [Streptomyces]ESU49284.1 putative serine protease [Streptomyces sp. HCCB10043]EWS92723.1 protease [Streptomyces filamentosus NRRL 11379]MYR79749.1 trypsin-like serine protease [Streptomyces sp. SID5466]USC48699.1 trypsin-like peptidase domain-containing protein [Streptomyces filamentosus]
MDMTENLRPSGAHSTDQDPTSYPYASSYGTAYNSATGGYPPPPAYAPTTGRRKAKRPVALLAAVAIAAGVIGGGTATLVGQLNGQNSATTGSGGTVNGTTVSQSSKGTVAGVAEAVSPAIVEIGAASSAGKSTGSGVVITEDGEIVTNNHVISGAQQIQVTLSTGRTYTADVVGTDPDKDLALIKLRGASGLKTATLGDSSKVKVGEEVVAIGSPEGLTGTVTSGIVSALDRDVTVAKDDSDSSGGSGQGQGRGTDRWPFEFGGQQFNGDTGEETTTYKALQTDASLNPGNSGGALINMNGEIIGINSAMYSPSSSAAGSGSPAGSVGLGFAIPVNTLKADLDTLRAGNGS